jgi:hypothetical protein
MTDIQRCPLEEHEPYAVPGFHSCVEHIIDIT